VEPVLVTERLTLRRFTPADVDGLLALDGDPAVMRYIGPRTKSRAQIEAEVLPTADRIVSQQIVELVGTGDDERDPGSSAAGPDEPTAP
jgi:RimJ/RimL family protein N-acetyltransferase